MTIAQIFCSVADLLAAKNQAGGDEAVMMRSIMSASDFLAKEIGWFIPVTETRLVDGEGSAKLITPPYLAIVSLTHDGTLLTASDYFEHPAGREWANGPYSWLEVNPDSTLLRKWKHESQIISMAARWGLYEASEATGTTLSATKQAIGDMSITVLNGGKISPGMVVKLDSEQELVTATGSPTASVTTAAAAVALADEEITLANETLVNIGEIIRIDFEKMLILDKNASTHKIVVTRQYNTSRQTAHLINAAVDVYRTFDVQRAINGTTAAEHALSSAVSRYLIPEDMGFLTREIATLMRQKELSNFAGRTGNTELGTVFYNDAFPRDDLARIKKLYTVQGQ